MNEVTGSPLGAPGYRLVDSDSHINEPPDLWTSRLPAKFKDGRRAWSISSRVTPGCSRG